MALSEKEKEKIVEEETLRFETRQGLMAQNGHGRCHGQGCRGACRSWHWLGWALALVFGLMLLCRGNCPIGGACPKGFEPRCSKSFAPLEPAPEAPTKK